MTQLPTQAGAGRRKVLQNELRRITDSLKRDRNVEKVFLFGSMASEEVTEWSDLDLVIIKRTAKIFLNRIKEMILLFKPRVGVDFFVYTPSEWRRMQETGSFFCREVVNKGVVLYER